MAMWLRYLQKHLLGLPSLCVGWRKSILFGEPYDRHVLITRIFLLIWQKKQDFVADVSCHRGAKVLIGDTDLCWHTDCELGLFSHPLFHRNLISTASYPSCLKVHQLRMIYLYFILLLLSLVAEDLQDWLIRAMSTSFLMIYLLDDRGFRLIHSCCTSPASLEPGSHLYSPYVMDINVKKHICFLL